MLASIRKNFAVGGRPKWTPLAASTRRRKKGGGILIGESKKLSGGFKPVKKGNSVSVENDVIYGPRQNFGYKGGTGRGHSKTPARRFVMFQPEDIDDIGKIFRQHIASGRIK
jgi:phage gpG-like protein